MHVATSTPHATAPAAGWDVLGQTQAEFAAARGTTPQAVRHDYRALMRSGAGVVLPPVQQVDVDAGVVKFCLSLPSPDGEALETESVVIPMRNYHGGSWRTLCVSSQIGCRMGCTFCETARMGLVRNLSAAEIVAQFHAARNLLPAPEPGAARQYRYFSSGIQNIVFMGMGEPLDNFDAVVHAIRVLNEPNGIAFPHAQMTLSTVGHLPGLRRLAALGWPNLRIAVSLHAAEDALRRQLVPPNKAYPLAELKRALLEYPLAPRGLFLIEVVLLAGVNDAVAQARQLAAWCRDLRCVVNLIPYNPQREAAYAAPSEEVILRFVNALRDEGVFVKRRLSYGRDLMGACGQLGNPSRHRVRAAV